MSTTTTETLAGTRKRDEHLSIDGKWRSFPKVPNLLQYVSNGNYYGRIKVSGKLIRESLDTDVWSKAKIRLADFVKRHHENRNQVDYPLFAAVADDFKRDVEMEAALKPKSKEYRLRCLKKIKDTWPELWDLRLDEITPEDCKEWAAEICEDIASHYYNTTVATLRMVIDTGLKKHTAKGGSTLTNPTTDIKRVRVKQKHLQLPEASQFKELIANIRKDSGGWGGRTADLIEFLAYSGTLVYSEALWVTWEDIDWQRKEIIVRGNPVTATKNGDLRRIPILPDMEKLLERIKTKAWAKATGKILSVTPPAGAFVVQTAVQFIRSVERSTV